MDDRMVRYQVFVSSTYTDLIEERQSVTSALLQLDAIPAGMELFPAADDDAWTLIKRVIDDSDYYLLVVGGRYGSVDPKEKLSYTEMEYDYAVTKGKPVMAFLHGNTGAISLEKSEIGEDQRKHLEKFRAKVENAKHVKYWTSAEDLAGKVALSFASFSKRYPATGWVRADRQASSDLLAEINKFRNRVAELEADIQATQFTPPPGTDALSQASDTVEFQVFAKFTLSAHGETTRRTGIWIDFKTTWDEVLAAVGAKLLQECEEDTLHEHLNTWVSMKWHLLDIDKKIREEFQSHFQKQGASLTGEAVEVDDEDFGVILVQLMALGLIQKSQRKRSVRDEGIYWTLTPYGENRTIQLKAMKRTPEE